MRALIMASASLETVMAPCSTCSANSLTRSRVRSRLRRVCSTIRSHITGSAFSTVCPAGAPVSPCRGSLMGPTFLRLRGLCRFGGVRHQSLQLVCIAGRFQEQLVELVVSLQTALEIRQFLPQLQKFPHRHHLPRDFIGLKILQALEMEIDLQLSGLRVVSKLVVHGKGKVGLHACQDAVEIIGVDLDEGPGCEWS